jgi:putative acetyltransferase
MLNIVQATTAEQIASARALMREYQSFLGVDLCFQGFEAELRNLPGEYAPPGGRLFLASHNEVITGCVALRNLDGRRCEMKRLFVRPGARGMGVGNALVTRVIDEARAIGYSEIVLDTLPSLTAALRIYEQFGFRDIAPYCVNPLEGVRFLGKMLA